MARDQQGARQRVTTATLFRYARYARVVVRRGTRAIQLSRQLAEARTRAAHLQRLATRMRATLQLATYVLTLNPAPARLRRRFGTPGITPRARIIANPTSGSLRGVLGVRELERTVEWLAAHGLPAELTLTAYPGHAAELAAEAVANHLDMVIAAGGDGTVNDVVQALAGHETALGVLPLGTVNVWAREMNIPLSLAQAREVLLSGCRRRVDLGRAGSRYFLMMAGIGFDAEVARRVEQSRLKRIGLKLLDYLATAGFLSVTQSPARLWLRSDGTRRSLNALMVVIGNTRLYGGAFTFANQALADDGLLDLVVIGGGGLAHRLGVIARALLRRPSLGPRVRYMRCRTVRIESRTPLPVQVDGEVVGTLPMTFTVVPHALTVIVPHAAPGELFVATPEV
jgi:diacylglycerol kinase (ATP)